MLCFQGVTLKSVMLEFSSIVYLTASLFLILCSMIITTLFRPTCRKPLSLAVAKSHFFSRLIKATILAQAWNFSSVCWKLCCFLLPFSYAIALQLSTSHSFPALFTSKVPYHPIHIFTFSPAHALRIQWLLPFLSGIGLKLLTSLITARPFSYISSVRHSIMCDPPHGSAT